MTRMLLRNSERQTFKTCQHRWQWTYRDGFQAATASTALRFGDLIHQALAAYYKPGLKRGPHPAKTFIKLYQEQATRLGEQGFDVYTDEKWEPALDLGAGMLEGYVDHFKEEDKAWKVLASEQTFQLRVKTPPVRLTSQQHPPRPLVFWAVGTFDGVWRNTMTNRVVFKEFKTASALATDALSMDEQAGMYWTYGPKWLVKQGVLKEGELPSSILYTLLRKMLPPDKPRNDEGQYLNKDGSVSKQQPAPFFHREPIYRDQADRARHHNRVCQEAINVARARLRPDEENVKTPGPWYMPNCRGCPVREACEVHEAGGDAAAVFSASMVPWDPYADHELAERF